MKDSVDSRYVTSDFLQTYFPSPNKFNEIIISRSYAINISEKRYLKFKAALNQERNKSGKPILSDSDLVQIIKKAEGYLIMPADLKRNDAI
jgi:hypothetical protein